MGKVITNKIVILSSNEPIVVDSDGLNMTPSNITTQDQPAGSAQEPMHLDEETILVFDEQGQCIGNVSHRKVKDLQQR